jgi:hypothetical protein
MGHLLSSSNIWPIQTSSPNPTRWKHWRKQNGAALLEYGGTDGKVCVVLSFCHRSQPCCSIKVCRLLSFSAVYVFNLNNNFQSRLEESLQLLDGLMLPITDDKAIDAVLKVLQMEREQEKMEAE